MARFPDINFEVMAPTTSADTVEFRSNGGDSISANDLNGAETVAIEKQSGSDWVPVTNGEGENTLTATDPVGFLRSAGNYRVVKSVTAQLCGVYLN